MSPLACSLFALGAMLATAHGLCTTEQVGYITGTGVPYEPVYFHSPGVEVHLDDNNCPYQMHVVGEDITVCNGDSLGSAPHIDGPEWPSFSPFRVTCDKYECPYGGHIDVKQYCAYWSKNLVADV